MRFKEKNTDTTKFTSWLGLNGELYIIPTKHRHASKLNRILKQYNEDTKFTSQDEPVFRINVSELDEVLEVLGSSRIKQQLIEE